jgi:hypothetical protein
MQENDWIRLLIDVSGVTESRAKCVVMYLDLLQDIYYPRFSSGASNGELNGKHQIGHNNSSHRFSADSRQLFPAEQIENSLHTNPARNGDNAS